jgi:hypothetical protein
LPGQGGQEGEEVQPFDYAQDKRAVQTKQKIVEEFSGQLYIKLKNLIFKGRFDMLLAMRCSGVAEQEFTR